MTSLETLFQTKLDSELELDSKILLKDNPDHNSLYGSDDKSCEMEVNSNDENMKTSLSSLSSLVTTPTTSVKSFNHSINRRSNTFIKMSSNSHNSNRVTGGKPISISRPIKMTPKSHLTMTKPLLDMRVKANSYGYGNYTNDYSGWGINYINFPYPHNNNLNKGFCVNSKYANSYIGTNKYPILANLDHGQNYFNHQNPQNFLFLNPSFNAKINSSVKPGILSVDQKYMSSGNYNYNAYCHYPKFDSFGYYNNINYNNYGLSRNHVAVNNPVYNNRNLNNIKGIYYIKNNYGDINTHIDQPYPSKNDNCNKNVVTTTYLTSSTINYNPYNIHFNAPKNGIYTSANYALDSGYNKVNSATSTSKDLPGLTAYKVLNEKVKEAKVFVNAKGEYFKLKNVKGTSYVVPFSANSYEQVADSYWDRDRYFDQSVSNDNGNNIFTTSNDNGWNSSMTQQNYSSYGGLASPLNVKLSQYTNSDVKRERYNSIDKNANHLAVKQQHLNHQIPQVHKCATNLPIKQKVDNKNENHIVADDKGTTTAVTTRTSLDLINNFYEISLNSEPAPNK
ncbi:homeobox protein 2-like [Gordionus sp. m RMFG-2023]|uniref:homeobox protein 2-like n=1 Tax=Gordionus sp. m RMFG-2023 TaxID=3053472 RepID=UPI0031FC8943